VRAGSVTRRRSGRGRRSESFSCPRRRTGAGSASGSGMPPEGEVLGGREIRSLPPPRTGEEETAAEPWFYVGERDIFPEEFRSFLGLRKELRDVFLEHHDELLHVDFWHRMQDLHTRGEVVDIYPYKSQRRLRASLEEPRR